MSNEKDIAEELKERFKFVGTRLRKLELKPVENQKKEIKAELNVSNKLKIKEITDELLVIENNVRMFFDPKAFFELSLVLEGAYKLKEKKEDNKEFIEQHLKAIGYQLLFKTSLIVAFITEQVLEVPVILPPATTDDEDE